MILLLELKEREREVLMIENENDNDYNKGQTEQADKESNLGISNRKEKHSRKDKVDC